MLNLHFPTPIYVADTILNVQDHQYLKEKCDEVKEKITKPAFEIGWLCPTKTSFGDKTFVYQDEDFNKLVETKIAYVKSFITELTKAKLKVIPTNCWMNVANKGDYQERHTHPNSVISSIYYVKAPKDCGNTIFFNPYQRHFDYLGEENVVTQQNTIYTPVEGRLVLFESHVPHAVTPQITDKERITISTNFTIEEITEGNNDNG